MTIETDKEIITAQAANITIHSYPKMMEQFWNGFFWMLGALVAISALSAFCALVKWLF